MLPPPLGVAKQGVRGSLRGFAASHHFRRQNACPVLEFVVRASSPSRPEVRHASAPSRPKRVRGSLRGFAACHHPTQASKTAPAQSNPASEKPATCPAAPLIQARGLNAISRWSSEARATPPGPGPASTTDPVRDRSRQSPNPNQTSSRHQGAATTRRHAPPLQSRRLVGAPYKSPGRPDSLMLSSSPHLRSRPLDCAQPAAAFSRQPAAVSLPPAPGRYAANRVLFVNKLICRINPSKRKRRRRSRFECWGLSRTSRSGERAYGRRTRQSAGVPGALRPIGSPSFWRTSLR